MTRIHRIIPKKKKSLNELNNHYGVVTYLESDILDYEVK